MKTKVIYRRKQRAKKDMKEKHKSGQETRFTVLEPVGGGHCESGSGGRLKPDCPQNGGNRGSP